MLQLPNSISHETTSWDNKRLRSREAAHAWHGLALFTGMPWQLLVYSHINLHGLLENFEAATAAWRAAVRQNCNRHVSKARSAHVLGHGVSICLPQTTSWPCCCFGMDYKSCTPEKKTTNVWLKICKSAAEVTNKGICQFHNTLNWEKLVSTFEKKWFEFDNNSQTVIISTK